MKPTIGCREDGRFYVKQEHVPSGLAAEGFGTDLDETDARVKAELAEKVEAWEKRAAAALDLPGVAAEAAGIATVGAGLELVEYIEAEMGRYEEFRAGSKAERDAVVGYLCTFARAKCRGKDGRIETAPLQFEIREKMAGS